MNCRERSFQIVESARAGTSLTPELREHVRECRRCSDRWEMEQSLSMHIAATRSAALVSPRADARRQLLMAEFQRRSVAARNPWRWGLAVAASLLLALALNFMLSHHPATPASTPSEAAEASGDFIPVPYAPPIAEGEFLRVERTEVHPIALVRMGIDIDSSTTDAVTADLLVGEDDVPRAVRVLDRE